MKLFAQIRKVDEAKRLVYGRAAEEVVDKADEIMDYGSSKPYFVKWSEDIAKDTDGKSLGNLRAMHGKVAAGKLTGIDFNDTEKAIDICAKVVDDGEWKKVLEGVYTGFSMGGSYVGAAKVEKMDGKDVKRYTANPSEISLVDRPCIPTAKFFDVQKADGTLAKVEFKEPAEEIDGGTINGTPEQVDELVKLMATNKLTLADVLAKIAPAAPATPAAVEKLDAGALRKSMYSCSYLADVIASLMSLKSSAQYEAFYEGDDSGIAAKLGAVISLAGQVLVEMVQEEVGEASAGADTTLIVELSEKAGALAKVDIDPFRALLKVGARNSAADKERLSKIHEMTVELGHECTATKAVPAAIEKVEPTDLEKAEVARKEELAKLVGEAVAPLQKALDDATAKITKLESQPAAPRVALRAVAKSNDVEPNAPIEKTTEPIVDAIGDKHEAAGLIKNLHQTGGAPLRKAVP